mmetsp:Transcript_13021/g.40106  ORF Transcript_13021/g.40106 Transcript_13021/m.40106 type:complete len:216 (-) Transcript_13021:3956-4603(-)
MIGWAAGLTARAEPRTPSLEKAVSRRALLLSAVTAVVPQVVVAAVPTIDDYYGTEGGAKKKVPGYVLPSRGERRGATSGEDKEASGGLISALDESQETVEELRRLVKALSWDDVRSVLGKKLAFLTTSRDAKLDRYLTQVFGSNAKKATEICKDAAITTKRLNDFAFSNRVIYFNSIDRRQVSELADSMSVDLDEPLELLDSLEESLQALLDLKS